MSMQKRAIMNLRKFCERIVVMDLRCGDVEVLTPN